MVVSPPIKKTRLEEKLPTIGFQPLAEESFSKYCRLGEKVVVFLVRLLDHVELGHILHPSDREFLSMLGNLKAISDNHGALGPRLSMEHEARHLIEDIWTWLIEEKKKPKGRFGRLHLVPVLDFCEHGRSGTLSPSA